MIVIIEDFYKNRPVRLYSELSPALRSERSGLKVIEEGNYCMDQPLTTRGNDIASTIRATIYKQGARNIMENIKNGNGYEGVIEPNYRIRKLTPSECYKLMGFTDEDCKKASDAGISNSQLYKQAGNSIVVQVMEALFRSLGEKYEDFRCPGITTSPD